MGDMNFWDWLAWFSLGSIVVWGILKVTGVINTPLLLQYYPLFAASYAVGWQMNKLSDMSLEFKRFRSETVKKIHNIELNCAKNH